MTRRLSPPLTLIFDADDTLWDSNVHFLEAEAAFIAAVTRTVTNAEADFVKATLRQCELQIIESLGYGRAPYVAALGRAVEALVELEDLQTRLRTEVEGIGARLLARHCETMPGVAATLGELATRHRLGLLTKGQPDEQLAKLERSRLAPLFAFVDVVAEKDEAAYRWLIGRERLDPDRTFMIGNSPRSDINPAVRAGLRAVFLPHTHTWELELEQVNHRSGRVIVLEHIGQLLDMF